ncbi:bifunctional 4-hydroxy-2-oxoglutarate aldolase/2-dehydro-3-deoxy-phosphogluconate aldolase [uncultured Sphaerochaeta sp.]|uniref:bifunctional 4-hydroxy-2-oxoglutarate aldolase/2-dehydro-3-deoxy-phosphogluconate aldolase n=1 Tax=uncultured Sphaerochaeta sp. TaxID=886478 RepID=UPI002A0A944C|nr:bifunctional 4-hydroxy-2-oxoglutarate aldolase/2-dehydro-3-deoxy-phosphogluconate aldolase [uncultured Sphaerochaeta sp.]
MGNKENVLAIIEQTKVISIIRGVRETYAARLIDALLDGGIRCLEITLNTPGALNIIKEARKREGIVVGAGTVLSLEDAQKAIEAGAQFILSPSLSVDIIKYCNSKDILPVPGVFSPTELYTASQAGAELIKVFPAGSVGPRYIKDLLGPFSGMKLLPVGGVSTDNTKEFMKAGAFAVGVGSYLANAELAKCGDFEEITKRAQSFIALAHNA